MLKSENYLKYIYILIESTLRVFTVIVKRTREMHGFQSSIASRHVNYCALEYLRTLVKGFIDCPKSLDGINFKILGLCVHFMYNYSWTPGAKQPFGIMHMANKNT